MRARVLPVLFGLIAATALLGCYLAYTVISDQVFMPEEPVPRGLWSVLSPNGLLELTGAAHPSPDCTSMLVWRVALRSSRNSPPVHVVDWSPMTFEADGRSLCFAPRPQGGILAMDEAVELRYGPARSIQVPYHQRRVSIIGKDGSGVLLMRAYDEGVALRWHAELALPGGTAVSERMQIVLAPGTSIYRLHSSSPPFPFDSSRDSGESRAQTGGKKDQQESDAKAIASEAHLPRDPVVSNSSLHSGRSRLPVVLRASNVWSFIEETALNGEQEASEIEAAADHRSLTIHRAAITVPLTSPDLEPAGISAIKRHPLPGSSSTTASPWRVLMLSSPNALFVSPVLSALSGMGPSSSQQLSRRSVLLDVREMVGSVIADDILLQAVKYGWYGVWEKDREMGKKNAVDVVDQGDVVRGHD